MAKRRPIPQQADRISERDLQECVRKLCKLLGLPYYHTHDSRRSPSGFPDCAIIKGRILYLWELKTMKGKVSKAQEAWLQALLGVEEVHVGVYRPDAWLDGSIERTLKDKP